MNGSLPRFTTPWGARPTLSGVHFNLWAPALEFVDLLIEGEIESLRLQRGDDGWHSLVTARARAGSRYWYVLPDGTRVPDPASAFQPRDVDGPSQVVDHSAYRWRDTRWRGLPWHTAVMYEIHVGAFSADGTFGGVREQLRRLVRLGVTAIQLMPVGDFRGAHSWGYDGVLPYAPDHTYGTPDDLKGLIEDAHALGLMVLLDVAYNRFEPLGLDFTDDSPRPVRDFVLGNALHWLEKYHVDGLRLVGVPRSFLPELAEAVRSRLPQRQVHLILGDGERHATLLERSRYGEIQWYDAQWNDRFHAQFLGDLDGLVRSEPGPHLPPDATIEFLQNHEQIGVQARGERLGHSAPEPALRALVATYLLLPQIPMLFMGEESNVAQPFAFFSHETPPEIFAAATLDWDVMDSVERRSWRERYSWLLELRHREIIPRIPSIERDGVVRQLGPAVIESSWRVGTVEELVLIANLSSEFADVPLPKGRVLWLEGARGSTGGLHAWSVLWIVRPAAT